MDVNGVYKPTTMTGGHHPVETYRELQGSNETEWRNFYNILGFHSISQFATGKITMEKIGGSSN